MLVRIKKNNINHHFKNRFKELHLLIKNNTNIVNVILKLVKYLKVTCL